MLVAVVTPRDGVQLWKMDAGVTEGLPVTGPVLPPVYLDGWERDEDGEVSGTQFLTRIDFPKFFLT